VVSKAAGPGQKLFDTLARLSRELEDAGHSLAAADLNDGVRCVNGLTDGWALLLEAIEKVQMERANDLTPHHRVALDEVRGTVRSLVYR
jgi:hypothetical protein